MTRIRDLSPTGVRLSPDTKEWIKHSAKENHRSISAEINFILEKYRKKSENKHA